MMVLNYEIQIEKKQDEILKAHSYFNEKFNQLEKENENLKMRIIPNVSISRIENMHTTIQEFQKIRVELEKNNKILREKNYELNLTVDYYETYKNNLEELDKRLKNSYNDELSHQLILYSSKLKEYKLAELKAKRECALAQEKDEYYQRLLQQMNESQRDLESQLADWDLKYAKREEFWQKRINEQMKYLYKGSNSNTQNTKVSQQKDINQIKATIFDDNFNKKVSEIEEIKNIDDKVKEIQELRLRLKEIDEILIIKDQKIQKLENAHKQGLTEGNSKYLSKGKQLELSSKIRIESSNEETTEMALAASKTIETLKDIIDDKNAQLQRKEEIIVKLREDALKTKEYDMLEIQKLNDQLHELQKDYNNNNQQSSDQVPEQNKDNSNMINDYRKHLTIKDNQIDELEQKWKSESQAKEIYQMKNKQYIFEINQLKEDLEIYKNKNNPEKLQSEIQILNKTLKKKDNDIKTLQNAVKAIKDDYFKTMEQKTEQEQQKKQAIEQLSVSNRKNYSELETKYQLMSQKYKILIDDQNKVNIEMETLRRKDKENIEKHQKLEEQLQKYQQKVNLNTQIPPSKSVESQKEVTSPKYFQEDKLKQDQEIKKLKETIESLQKNIDINNKELIDQDGNLKTASNTLGFKDVNEVLSQIKKWLVLNPSVNILKQFRSVDTKKTGFILFNDLQEQMEIAGLKLGQTAKDLINETFTKDQKIDYIQFYMQMKGLKVFEQQTEQMEYKETQFQTSVKIDNSQKTDKNTEILKKQMLDAKKEREMLEKQILHWKEKCAKYEKDLKNSQNKSIQQQPKQESSNMEIRSNIDQIQSLKDKIYELENSNLNLEKIINVDKEVLIKKLKDSQNTLQSELKTLKMDNLKLKSQIESYQNKASGPEIKEKIDYEKDMLIRNFKEKLEMQRQKEQSLLDKLFEIESSNLELKFIRENYDIQMERLNKRIFELEDFKKFHMEKSNTKKISTASAYDQRRTSKLTN